MFIKFLRKWTLRCRRNLYVLGQGAVTAFLYTVKIHRDGSILFFHCPTSAATQKPITQFTCVRHGQEECDCFCTEFIEWIKY